MFFSANGLIAVAATKTALILGSAATVRPRVCSYSWSTDGTPTSDQGIVMRIQRATALGTTTAVTPGAPEPSDATAGFLGSFGSNASVEPTYTTGAGILWEQGSNARATINWSAYDQRSELVAPATAANGIGWQMQQSGGAAGNVKVSVGVYM